VLNISLESAIKLIGHVKGTTTKELSVHIKLGKKTKKPTHHTALCISRNKTLRTNNWHWVLWMSGHIYDPCLGRLITTDEFKGLNMRISTYINIDC